MQRLKDTSAGAPARQKRTFLSPIIISVTILLVLLLLFLGFQFRFLIFPNPLSLSPGQDIKARFTINAVKPFHVGDLLPVTLELEARDGVTFPMPNLEIT